MGEILTQNRRKQLEKQWSLLKPRRWKPSLDTGQSRGRALQRMCAGAVAQNFSVESVLSDAKVQAKERTELFP